MYVYDRVYIRVYEWVCTTNGYVRREWLVCVRINSLLCMADYRSSMRVNGTKCAALNFKSINADYNWIINTHTYTHIYTHSL